MTGINLHVERFQSSTNSCHFSLVQLGISPAAFKLKKEKLHILIFSKEYSEVSPDVMLLTFRLSDTSEVWTESTCH